MTDPEEMIQQGRRVRRYAIPDELTYYIGQGLTVDVDIDQPLPPDAIRVRDYYDYSIRCQIALFEHISFDIVPPFAVAPLVIPRIRIHKALLLEDSV